MAPQVQPVSRCFAALAKPICRGGTSDFCWRHSRCRRQLYAVKVPFLAVISSCLGSSEFGVTVL